GLAARLRQQVEAGHCAGIGAEERGRPLSLGTKFRELLDETGDALYGKRGDQQLADFLEGGAQRRYWRRDALDCLFDLVDTREQRSKASAELDCHVIGHSAAP